MSVTLRALTQENLADCLSITISKKQQDDSMLPETIDIVKQVIEKDASGLFIYLDSQVIGFASFVPVNAPQRYQILHFLIDERYQNRGYGNTALRLLLKEMFTIDGCEIVSICYMSFNEGAQALYEKVGFVEKPTEDEGEGDHFAEFSIDKEDSL